jgi:hypothetical protein
MGPSLTSRIVSALGLETTADTAAELGPDNVQGIVEALGARKTARLAMRLGGERTGALVSGRYSIWHEPRSHPRQRAQSSALQQSGHMLHQHAPTSTRPDINTPRHQHAPTSTRPDPCQTWDQVSLATLWLMALALISHLISCRCVLCESRCRGESSSANRLFGRCHWRQSTPCCIPTVMRIDDVCRFGNDAVHVMVQ